MKTMFKFNKWIDKIEKYILEVWIFRLWLIVGVTASNDADLYIL